MAVAPPRFHISSLSTSHNAIFLSHPSFAISSSSSSPLSSSFSHSGSSSLSSSLLVIHRRRPPSRLPCGSAPVVKSAFLVECIGNIIRFVTKVPSKLFAQKLEADLDKAAKFIKTGASLVAEVAKEVDEIAEKVESVAERAEEIAGKVVETTETAEERIEEILDVLDGDDSTADHKQNQTQQTGRLVNPTTSPDHQESTSATP